MSVSKRKNTGQWLVKYKTAKGWKQKVFPPDKESEARDFDANWQYDQVEANRLTLIEAVLLFLENVEHCSKVIETYRYVVMGHDRVDGTHVKGPAEHLADRYLDSLNRRDLESVRSYCRDNGVSNSSINVYVSKIKAVMAWCADQDLIPVHPWAKYKALPSRHKSREGTLEDFRKLYECMPPWLKWAAQTSMALCLRPGMSELLTLKWDAFDWRQKLVTVFMSKTNATKIVYPPATYLAEASRRYEADKLRGNEYVCPDRRGRPVTSLDTFRKAWHAACRKANVKMPPYAMRHIAASEMLASGVDLAAVAAQLGHKNISTTASFYVHALSGAQKNAASALELGIGG